MCLGQYSSLKDKRMITNDRKSGTVKIRKNMYSYLIQTHLYVRQIQLYLGQIQKENLKVLMKWRGMENLRRLREELWLE